jgi:UDP-N-acetylmuramoylalanine--D-glutamate ligase
MNIIKEKSIRNQLLNKRKESLNSFSSIEHRLEFFSNKLEKIWINDSKSTDTVSTGYSLSNIDGPIIWIVGQNQSPRDLGILEDLVLSKVTEIIYYGKHETNIKYLFGSKIKYSQLSTIKDSVNMALNNPIKNIKVLFSPACSSYITHKNYQLRGDYFKNLIHSIV